MDDLNVTVAGELPPLGHRRRGRPLPAPARGVGVFDRRLFGIYFWLLPISGLLVTNKGNPFGIPFSSELYSVLAVIPFLISIVRDQKARSLDLLIFISPLIWIGWSAMMAHISYGQPVGYGLMEERRMLLLYLYFPFRFGVFRTAGPKDVLRPMLVLTVVISILGFLYQAGIVSGVRELETTIAETREGRANFGAPFVAMTLIFWLAAWREVRVRWYEMGALLLAFGFLGVVAQTRQILAGVIIAIILDWFLSVRSARRFMIMTGVMVLALVGAVCALLLQVPVAMRVLDMFVQLGSSEYLTESARSMTIKTVLANLSFFGHGALSQQWNDGFLGYYTGHFVLADIGILGTLHAFGGMAVGVVLMTLYYLFFATTGAYRHYGLSIGRAVLLFSVFLVALWPTSAIFEYRTAFLGFVIAIGAGRSMRLQPTRSVRGPSTVVLDRRLGV